VSRRCARSGLAALLLACVACGDGYAPEPPAAAGGGAAPAEPEVVALLDGEPIRREDVSGRVAFRIYRHQVDIYSLLKGEVERLVDERLLERAARARGTSAEALVAAAEARATPASEADVDLYLAEHPGEAAAGGERRARIRHYLDQTRRIEQRLALLEQLREEADYQLVLAPPEQPRTELSMQGAPARGPADASVTIVHFASFSSRSSAQSAQRLARLREEYPDAVRVVYRNFPTERDETGLLAARVGFLAQDAGRFWEYHDALFAVGGRIDRQAIASAAEQAGLGAQALERASADAALLDRVKADAESARDAGAPREPTLYVNGRYLSGLYPYEALRALVAEELGETHPARATSPAPNRVPAPAA